MALKAPNPEKPVRPEFDADDVKGQPPSLRPTSLPETGFPVSGFFLPERPCPAIMPHIAQGRGPPSSPCHILITGPAFPEDMVDNLPPTLELPSPAGGSFPKQRKRSGLILPVRNAFFAYQPLADPKPSPTPLSGLPIRKAPANGPSQDQQNCQPRPRALARSTGLWKLPTLFNIFYLNAPACLTKSRVRRSFNSNISLLIQAEGQRPVKLAIAGRRCHFL